MRTNQSNFYAPETPPFSYLLKSWKQSKLKFVLLHHSGQ